MPKGVYKHKSGSESQNWKGGKVNRVCRNCNKEFFVYPSRVKAGNGVVCSQLCVNKGKVPWNKGRSSELSNERHWNWKGEMASYGPKHSWNIRHWGNPLSCEYCGKTGSHTKFTRNGKEFQRWNIEWANKSREYKRNISDWIGLCKKCHVDYDDVISKMWITRKKLCV